MRSLRVVVAALVFGLGVSACVPPKGWAQPATETIGPGETPEEERERVRAERFFQLLKRRPRLGTAFDKVYGYHVGRGELEAFCESLATEAEASGDGALWLIHGMVQMQRSLDTEAAASFERAQRLLTDEPLADYYLGKTLVLIGEVEEAAEAMRSAIKKKPARADMLAIFQDLGRIYQRTGRGDDALKVWDQLEGLFPNDSQVREEIARILAEEGALEAAVDRYDALAESISDRFRKVEMTIRSAQLKAQLGQSDEALRAFESQLAKVNPDSWLHRDIRRRIEEVFWSSGDVDGLIAYYTKWVDEHPEDIDAMMRAARFLAVQQRLPEAKQWFRKAIEKAPSSAEPRLALVEALVTNDERHQAADEMAALVELSPNDPDYVIRWGELVASDPERGESQRKTEAAEIWRRLLEKRGEDPVTVSRVADLLRGVEATDEAIAEYRKAIELAPTEPQYREYLGEYLHQLGRKDEAVEVWRSLASEDRRTRDNLVRLSEVLSTFAYRDEALETIAEACEMNPEFGHRARFAELLREADRHDEALAQLDLAEPLAEDPELREIVIAERIKNYQESGVLAERIDQAEADVAGDQSGDPDAWRLLALLREADRKYQPACEAVEKACELSPGDSVMWETAAALQERSGRFGDAIQSYRKLAALDRRFLSNYLTQIASLEMRVGNTDAALRAGEELIASAPGNSEHYRFFADLCFQVGEEDRGLKVLRRCVRSSPNDSDTLLYLARQLSEAFRTGEAIELYWRGFDLASDLDGKTAVVTALTELYLRTNRFGMFTDRLEATGREQNKPREGLLWVAAAHQAAGDLGMAKQMLERLAREDSRDTKLLTQLVTLSRAESDFESAAEYQKRLVAVAPTPEAEYQLASILLDLGEIDQSEALWLKLAQRKSDPGALSDTVSMLVRKDQYETADLLVEKALAKDPADWEMMTQAMLIDLRLGNQDEARQLAERVLTLDVDPGEPTEKVRQRIARQANKRRTTPVNYDPYQNLGRRSRMLQTARQIKAIVEPGVNDPYAYSNRRSGYEPSCFLDALSIAYSVPLVTAKNSSDRNAFVKTKADEALQSMSADDLWQALFYLAWQDLQIVYGRSSGNQSIAELYEKCLDELVSQGDPEAAGQALTRFVNLRQQNANGGPGEPLDEEELRRVRELTTLTATADRGSPSHYSLWVAMELARSGHDEEASELIDEYIARAQQSANGGLIMLQAMNALVSDRFNQDVSEATIKKARTLFSQSLGRMKLDASSGARSGQQFHGLAKQLVKHDSAEGALECVAEMLQWQAEQTASLRPSQRNRLRSNAPLNLGHVVNGVYEQVTIAFPTTSSYFGAGCICLVHGLYDACKDNPDNQAKVRARLAEWASEETDDPYLRLARLMARASFAYWEEDYSVVKTCLETASDLQVGGQFVDLALTRLLYDSGDASGALEVVERLRPANQQMLVDKELATLQLVLQLGDLDRARKSAQKLFALRLPSETEFKLADLMYQLGMKELGDRMMGRIRRRAGGKQDTLVKLMTRYASAGKNKEAAEIARQVIRRTEPRGLSRSYRSGNAQHEQAVRVLAQTKQLQPLIERYEKLVERSPRSTKLVDQLAAFYNAAGRRAEAQELRVESAENAPEDPRSLFAAGQRLASAGKSGQAVEKFVAAVRKSPELLNRNYYEMRDTFENAKAWSKLSDGIVEEGIGNFSQSYRMSEIMQALAKAEDHAAINRLLYAGLNEMPLASLSRMMYSVTGGKIEVEERVAELLGDKLVAKDADLASLSRNTFVFSRSSGGMTSGSVNGVAFIVSQDDALKQRVADAMSERLEKKQDELFPRVLLAMIHIYDKRFEDVERVLQPLKDKKQKNQNDGQAIWCLASALVYEAYKPAIACELLESVGDETILERDQSEFEYGAKSLLAAAYRRANRRVDAHRVLVEQLETMEIDSRQNQYNPGYGEYRYIESMASLSERFVKMDYPAEAFIAFRKAFGDEELTARAGRWGGNSDWRRDRLTEQIAKKTTVEKVLSLVAAAIKGPTGDAQAQSAVVAYLTSPEVSRRSLIDARVTMPLEDFTVKIAEGGGLRSAVGEWLDDNPLDEALSAADLKPLVTRLLISDAAGDAEAARETADAIIRWFEEHAPERDAPVDDVSKATPAESLPDELLLAMAVSRFPDGVADAATLGGMLERARTVAEQNGLKDLANGLQCQIAQNVAVDDPDRAREIFLEALDRVLPAEGKTAVPDPVGS